MRCPGSCKLKNFEIYINIKDIMGVKKEFYVFQLGYISFEFGEIEFRVFM